MDGTRHSLQVRSLPPRAALAGLATLVALASAACQSTPRSDTQAASDQELSPPPAPSASSDSAPSELQVAPADYPRAFEAAKRTLRDLGFLVERVDAQAGVILTQARPSIGAFAPTDPVQSGLDQELDDAMHRQTRVVRVQFSTPPAISSEVDPVDLRTSTAPLTMSVQASVHRAYVPGRRINTGHILYSTSTYDPALGARGMSSYSVAIEQDSRLAQRIIDQVRDRLIAPADPD